MLSAVRVRNSKNNKFIDAYVGDRTSQGGFTLKGFDGLGPAGAQIAYSEYALLPGGSFHSANTGIRNPVLTIGLSPRYDTGDTVLSLRKQLYSVLKPGQRVTLSLYFDGTYTSYISGYVERVEPNIFTAEPTLQVSIICVSPYFQAPSLISEVWKAGTTKTITYLGDVDETGFTLVVQLKNASTTMVKVTDPDTSYALTVNVSPAITLNQQVVFDTRKGSKGVSLVDSSGVIIRNLMGELTVDKGWPSLSEGVNKLLITHTSGANLADVAMDYREQYLGY